MTRLILANIGYSRVAGQKSEHAQARHFRNVSVNLGLSISVRNVFQFQKTTEHTLFTYELVVLVLAILLCQCVSC